jgi:trans-aconitate methyltransferase
MNQEYLGVDFMPNLVETAQKKFPDNKFMVADVLDLEKDIKEKFDVAFTFTCFLHVIPEDMERAAASVKKIAKWGVFVEPTQETWRVGDERSVNKRIIEKQKNSDWIFNVKYTHVHDYFKYFNVVKAIPMPDNRTMFIVDLTK